METEVSGASPALSSLFSEFAGILMDPSSDEAVQVEDGALAEANGGRRIPVVDGIPNFFVPARSGSGLEDVTEIVKAFYEDTPFPNYDGLDSRESLAAKATQGGSDRSIP